MFGAQCGGAVLPGVRGELRFHDVWFRYDTRPDAAVLRGISLTIAPSQTIAGRPRTCASTSRTHLQ